MSIETVCRFVVQISSIDKLLVSIWCVQWMLENPSLSPLRPTCTMFSWPYSLRGSWWCVALGTCCVHLFWACKWAFSDIRHFSLTLGDFNPMHNADHAFTSVFELLNYNKPVHCLFMSLQNKGQRSCTGCRAWWSCVVSSSQFLSTHVYPKTLRFVFYFITFRNCLCV